MIINIWCVIETCINFLKIIVILQNWIILSIMKNEVNVDQIKLQVVIKNQKILGINVWFLTLSSIILCLINTGITRVVKMTTLIAFIYYHYKVFFHLLLFSLIVLILKQIKRHILYNL